MKKSYQVAGHCFTVEAEDSVFSDMAQYEPFLMEQAMTHQVFALKVSAAETAMADYTIQYQQKEEGQEIACGITPDGQPVFEFRWMGETAGQLICSADYQTNILTYTNHPPIAGMMYWRKRLLQAWTVSCPSRSSRPRFSKSSGPR